MATSTHISCEVQSENYTGRQLLAKLKDELGIWGGTGHSVRPCGDYAGSVTFDPCTVDGGAMRVLGWLESLGEEYRVTFTAWLE